MKKNKNIINVGGINGLGESLINTNSESFKQLKLMIHNHYSATSQDQVVENQLLGIRFQMESYLSQNSDTIIASGVFVEKLLEVIKVTKKRFAEYLEYDYSNLIAVLKGRRKINPDLAVKLGQIFKINPAIWLHLESKNELKEYMKRVELSRTYSLVELIK